MGSFAAGGGAGKSSETRDGLGNEDSPGVGVVAVVGVVVTC